MKIVARKSACIDDWYVIEKAHHDGRKWINRIGPNSGQLMCSSRISDADIEGTHEEIIAIANAIKNRTSISFKRCSVSFCDDGVHLCSPRNSTRDGIITIKEADDLADQIFNDLNG